MFSQAERVIYQEEFSQCEDSKALLRQEVRICELRPDEAQENTLKKTMLSSVQATS